MSVAIGIDLGTTNTAVAAVIDGVASTLVDNEGRRLLPSVVSFHPTSTVLVGEPARERRLIDPENTVYSVKPLLGRAWESDEVALARGRFPFKLAPGAKNSTMVVARGIAYALPEISAFVLRRAKAIAEAALGQQVDRAVITVPANFNDLQRASTKIAGKLAGLEVMRILNEPTAAALAYGQSIAKAEKIAVYDLGGGTFDITLLDLTGNVFEVLATAGDTALGGDDVDRLVADRIGLEVTKRFNVDPRTSAAGIARLTFIAEEIKKELSRSYRAQREIAGVGHLESGAPIVMPFVMTREELENACKPLIDRTIAMAKQSIDGTSLKASDFDRVILVGGSTRIPAVARAVEQFFGKPAHLRVNPDEVVALGAAIQAHALNRSKSAHKRRSAHDELAKSDSSPAGERVPTRAPDHDPAPTPDEVPRAAPVPEIQRGVNVPPLVPGSAKQGQSGTMPEFLSFNKAPAVISFSKPPPRTVTTPAGPAPPPPPPPPPPPQRRSAPDLRPPAPESRASAPEIPDLPPAVAPSRKPPVPPPRTPSGAPSPPAVYELDLDEAAPEETAVAGADFFSALELTKLPAPTAEEFRQGSAVATAAAAPLLIDVTPLSLGVETAGGYVDVIIPANSPVPCEKTRTFRTASDSQTSVAIRVSQGESTRFIGNTRLGDLVLSGLRPGRRGDVRITVTFELDADGLLNVRAVDPDTGHETAATMRLLGASTDAEDVGAMAERQARHVVA